MSEPAQAIRNVYLFLGTLLNPDSSWEFLGWTADLNPPHVGCGSFSLCQLFIHYVPNPQFGYWGSIMDFQKHPLTVTFNGNQVPVNQNAIMAGRWNVDAAYWVQPAFYLSWLFGANQPMVPPNADIGLPLMNQIGTNAILCPAGEGCTGYQRFSHGYIWEKTGTGVQTAVFCPDVNAPTLAQWPDYSIDLFNDISGTIAAFDATGENTPTNPTAPWENARFDVNGDGKIDLFNDITQVINHFSPAGACIPGL